MIFRRKPHNNLRKVESVILPLHAVLPIPKQILLLSYLAKKGHEPPICFLQELTLILNNRDRFAVVVSLNRGTSKFAKTLNLLLSLRALRQAMYSEFL